MLVALDNARKEIAYSRHLNTRQHEETKRLISKLLGSQQKILSRIAKALEERSTKTQGGGPTFMGFMDSAIRDFLEKELHGFSAGPSAAPSNSPSTAPSTGPATSPSSAPSPQTHSPSINDLHYPDRATLVDPPVLCHRLDPKLQTVEELWREFGLGLETDGLMKEPLCKLIRREHTEGVQWRFPTHIDRHVYSERRLVFRAVVALGTERPVSNDKAAEYLQQYQTKLGLSLHRMRIILNDVLKVSKISNGKTSWGKHLAAVLHGEVSKELQDRW